MPDEAVYSKWQTREVNNRWVLLASEAVCRFFPRSVLYTGAEAVVDHYLDSHPDVEQTLSANLGGAFPDLTREERLRMGRRTVLNYARGVVDFLRAGWDPPNVHCIDSEGRAYMQKPGAKIILTAHMGNWELGGCTLGEMVVDAYVLAFPERDPGVDRFRMKRRNRSGLETHLSNGQVGDLFRLRKILNAGGSVVLLVDRTVGKDRAQVTFCNRKTYFLKSPALLSALTGVPMLPVAVMSEGGGRYVGHVGKPIRAEGDDPHRAMQDVADFFGEILDRYPDQWYNFYPFWEERV